MYNGTDFVPHIAHALSSDDQCAPFVLCDEWSVGAFLNVRRRKCPESENSTFFFDGMRVRESMRGKKLGTLTLATAMHAVRSNVHAQHVRNEQIAFLAVTNPQNKAMRKVFHNLKWTSHEIMHVWPTADVVIDAKRRNMRLVDTIDVTKSITTEMAELSKKWTKIFKADEILTGMKLLHEKGASFQQPLYYDVQSAESASTFLDDTLALVEHRSVWRLQVENRLRGVMFVRANIVEDCELCKHSLISACVIDVPAAESCIVHASEHLKLDYFHVVYDAPIRSHDISQSKVLSCAPSEPFVIYRHDGTDCQLDVKPTWAIVEHSDELQSASMIGIGSNDRCELGH